MSTPEANYQYSFEPTQKRVQVVVDGELIAASDSAVIVRETRQPDVFYIPLSAVRIDLSERTETRTYCPFRGNASYWRFRINGTVYEDLMWGYEKPLAEADVIKDHVAFFTDRVQLSVDDDVKPSLAPAAQGQLGNPLTDWLIRDAPNCKTGRELTAQLADRLLAVGISVWRIAIVIRTLHPQVVSFGYRWRADSRDIEESQATYLTLESPQFQNSPLVPIFEGAGGIRRRLDVADPRLDFEILNDLRAEGATDYVAMPMQFSNGNINAITLASDRPGGFTTSELGHVYEILGNLSRLYEVHAQRRTATRLLEVYLGKQAGSRVLQGAVQRGDGEQIQAVIWFCDLRRSTALAASMPQHDFLAMLNEYFDAMAGAVMAHHGQILRFIGDAALAIFPISDETTQDALSLPLEAAAHNALQATLQARDNMQALNTTRTERGEKPLGYGVALNIGEVTYGNIGTHERLEFTVIGDAANRAAKIESLCKRIGQNILLAQEFAKHFPQHTTSIGLHRLAGIRESVELFTLNENTHLAMPA